jgi:UDP-N-acetylglucosamine diphosphorylase / glucose-1-phosphate thymidylyltransferase / UDP-N-acetylgalactosamine diphosphorylase / glucosamine-1-phosphate N-acetyltransferase / galactosamine-1-phosphate N-acetyltransferase
MDAIVMAAGEGTRLRPLTRRWPKPVLPIDGRAVLATLLHELQRAQCGRVWLVSGHLAEQVERLAGDGSAFGVEVVTVRQPAVLGSADAVQRALDAGAGLPCIAVAADTVFRRGDVRLFHDAFAAASAVGAIAVRRNPPPGDGRRAVLVRDERVHGIDVQDGKLSGAPLWGMGASVAERLCRDREPYELENAFRATLDAGEPIAAIEIGSTRDLTDPLDLVEENFPYLSGT